MMQRVPKLSVCVCEFGGMCVSVRLEIFTVSKHVQYLHYCSNRDTIYLSLMCSHPLSIIVYLTSLRRHQLIVLQNLV